MATRVWKHVTRGMRVEVARGLVRHEERRGVGDGPGDGDALLLAAGQLRRAVMQPLAQPQEREKLRRPLPRLALAQAADDLRHDHVLDCGELRQEVVELIDEADLLPAQARAAGIVHGRGRAPLDENLAPVRLLEKTATCRSVDLPVPDGATRATISPGQMARSAPLRMSRNPSPSG
jgi:hypothetical protein